MCSAIQRSRSPSILPSQTHPPVVLAARNVILRLEEAGISLLAGMRNSTARCSLIATGLLVLGPATPSLERGPVIPLMCDFRLRQQSGS